MGRYLDDFLFVGPLDSNTVFVITCCRYSGKVPLQRRRDTVSTYHVFGILGHSHRYHSDGIPFAGGKMIEIKIFVGVISG